MLKAPRSNLKQALIFLRKKMRYEKRIKILKRSLIDEFTKTRAFDCQSAVFDR